MAMTELGNTLGQMGRNVWDDPMKFITHDGIGATGRAVTNGAKSAVNSASQLINNTVYNVNDRSTPEENFENGNSWGSRIKDTFTPSNSARSGNKQHASNLMPGERNIHGGWTDITA